MKTSLRIFAMVVVLLTAAHPGWAVTKHKTGGLAWKPTDSLSNHTLSNSAVCPTPISNAAPQVGSTSCVDSYPNPSTEGQTHFPITAISRSGSTVTVQIVDNYNFSTSNDKVTISGVLDSANFPSGTYTITALGSCTSSGSADCTLSYSQDGSPVSSFGGIATRYSSTQSYIPAPANIANRPNDGVDIHDIPFHRIGQKTAAKIFAHFMPWFSCANSTHGNCVWTPKDGTTATNLDHGLNIASSHVTVGYVSNSSSQVTAQIDAMARLGFDGLIGDSSGAPFSGASSTRKNEIAVFDKVSTALSSRTDFLFAVFLDDSSFKTSATCGTSGQLPTCVEKVIECSLDYYYYPTSQSYTCAAGAGSGTSPAPMNGGGYFSNPSYYKISGHPVTGTFFAEGRYFTACSNCSVYNDGIATAGCTGSTACWNAIWAGVAHHIASYSISPIFLWRNNFNHTCIGTCIDNGSYRWINPTGDRTNADFSGYDNWLCSGSPCSANSAVGTARHVMTAGYPRNDHAQSSFQSDNLGFDNVCGNNWIRSLSEPNSNTSWFTPTNDIEAIQVLTWNDHEQGTAIENGIVGCYGLSASINSGTVSFSITTSDMANAPIPINTSVNATLDHLALYAVKSGGAIGNLDTMKLGNVPIPSSGLGTINVAGYGLQSGTYSLYVKLVPRAGMQTSISKPLSFIVP